MFFRNLMIFRLPPGWNRGPLHLDQALESHALREPGALEFGTIGFVRPRGADAGAFDRTLDHASLIALAFAEKVLPPAVIRDEVATRVRRESAQHGKPIGGRRRRELRNEAVDALLPKALVRRRVVHAYIDFQAQLLIVDAASVVSAEQVLTMLRECFGTFPVLPLEPNMPPRAAMTQWLARETAPAPLDLGDECILRDPATRARWSARSVEFTPDQIVPHIHAGAQVMELGLTFDDRISFALTEALAIRRLRFLDLALDELPTDADSVDAELDARFVLMVREVRRLFQFIESTFDLAQPEAVEGTS